MIRSAPPRTLLASGSGTQPLRNRVGPQRSAVGIDAMNPVGSVARILVFPDTHDGPSCGVKAGVDLLIALHVSFKLRRPIVGVGLRRRSVFGTAVPEAAVDKDGNASRREHDIGSDAEPVRVDPVVRAKSEAKLMKRGPYAQLRRGAGAPVGAHTRGRCGARGRWSIVSAAHRIIVPSACVPTGPPGRITQREDIRAHGTAAPTLAYRDRPFLRCRRLDLGPKASTVSRTRRCRN